MNVVARTFGPCRRACDVSAWRELEAAALVVALAVFVLIAL